MIGGDVPRIVLEKANNQKYLLYGVLDVPTI